MTVVVGAATVASGDSVAVDAATVGVCVGTAVGVVVFVAAATGSDVAVGGCVWVGSGVCVGAAVGVAVGGTSVGCSVAAFVPVGAAGDTHPAVRPIVASALALKKARRVKLL